MYKTVLLFTAVVAVALANAPEPANRFLAATKTTTSVIISTTTIPTTKARTCYTTTAAISQCRRRRSAEEQPELILGDGTPAKAIKPSKPEPVEITAAPVSDAAAPKEAPAADIQSSTEVEITGLSDCLARSAFGVTIYYTTSTTVVISAFSTILSGSSPFTVVGCTPLGWTYSAC